MDNKKLLKEILKDAGKIELTFDNFTIVITKTGFSVSKGIPYIIDGSTLWSKDKSHKSTKGSITLFGAFGSASKEKYGRQRFRIQPSPSSSPALKGGVSAGRC